LRNIASQFGIQLNGPAPEGVDFVPFVDVFDTSANYIVHVSLPGAKKDDLSIDYDPDESVLRLAGVVYRPGISEDLHQALALEERSREIGVFEREVRLGTHEAPALISIHDISAKLEEGVLNVTLPKIAPEPELKKKVVVEDGNIINEKDAMQMDEKASVTVTPSESDESDSDDGETKEYVKVPVH
jgi:HSP20 family protein